MIDLDNIKGKVITAVGVVADTTKDIADKAGDKARDISRVAKLTFEINSEKDVIKKAYFEIGKLYYETYKENPEGFFIQLCDEVTLAMENISAKEAEIAALKDNSSIDDDDSIVVEFEEIIDEPASESDVSIDDIEPESECSCGCDNGDGCGCDDSCDCHDGDSCGCGDGDCTCHEGDCDCQTRD